MSSAPPGAEIDFSRFWKDEFRRMEDAAMYGSGSRVDEVLGFAPPNWLDEVFAMHGINRQSAPKEKIRKILDDVKIEARNRLARQILELSYTAEQLGFTVARLDLKEMAAVMRTATIDDTLFKTRFDPRP